MRDTGVGIAAKDLPQLFERFHRVVEARGRTYEGSGIGLALVQELVKLHGGTVRVESESGGQRVYRFDPLRLSAPARRKCQNQRRERVGADRDGNNARAFVEEALRWAPIEAKAKRAERRRSSMQRMRLSIFPSTFRSIYPARILLADDNSDMREYVRRLLAAITRSKPSPTARPHCKRRANVRQPSSFGRDDAETRWVRLVEGFARRRAPGDDSGHSTFGARRGGGARRGDEAGADDYLIKPFSARELLARVRAHLEMTRLRRDAEMALRHSEKLFRELADNAPLIIWMTDDQGNNEFVNKAYLTFFGVAPEDVAERRWMELVHPGDYKSYAPEV